MARISVVALLVCLFVVAAGDSVIAQQPRPSPLTEDQRFEFPTHRIALTIPAGWRVKTGPQGLPIFDRVLVARQADGPGRCIVETFEFDGVRPDDIAWTLSIIRGYRRAQIAPAIELPGGEAVRLHSPDLPKMGQAGTSDTYVFATDDGYAWLTCSTTGPYAGPLWYSIAESIEFLPAKAEQSLGMTAALPTCRELQSTFEQDATTGHVLQDAAYLTRCVTCEELFNLVNYARVADTDMGMAILSERCDWPRAANGIDGAGQPSPSFGQRVEVPEASYAVTFPEDWTVEIVEEDSDTTILSFDAAGFGPDVESHNLLVASGPGGRGADRDAFNLCTLVRYEPIELTADEFLNEVFGQSEDLAVESLHEGLSRVFMNQFLSGRVITDQPEHFYVEHYAIGGDNTVAVLWCTGVLSHREEWLSIAESFEFLPAE